MIVPLTITLSLFWGNFRATNYLAWPYLIWIFLPYLLYWSVPPLFSKSLFCCYPTSRLPKCPFSYRSNGKMWFRKWSKKVTFYEPNQMTAVIVSPDKEKKWHFPDGIDLKKRETYLRRFPQSHLSLRCFSLQIRQKSKNLQFKSIKDFFVDRYGVNTTIGTKSYRI